MSSHIRNSLPLVFFCGMLLGACKPSVFIQSEPPVVISTGAIHSGDNIVLMIKNSGINLAYAGPIEKQLGSVFDLRRMQPGHQYEAVCSTDGILHQFTYRTDAIHEFKVLRSSTNVFSVVVSSKQTEWREKRIDVEVQTNLYKDLLLQGHPEPFVANVISDLADNIFAWRIDFFTEQRPGDHLKVLMEQEYVVGETTPLWNGRGRILVASYTGKATRVKDNTAIRYLAEGAKRADYYDEEGNAVRRAFLRAPFTHGSFRISSGFVSNRYNSILRVYTPHHGIDYAAPFGTWAAAIGKGKVVFAGWKGGYGNCIEIKHSSKYISRYGHLSKILVRLGQSVEQGQHVGNVGSTGLSTGPHLHFEMMVDGEKRNFLTMNFPAAAAIADNEKSAFNQKRDVILAHFKSEFPVVSASTTTTSVTRKT